MGIASNHLTTWTDRKAKDLPWFGVGPVTRKGRLVGIDLAIGRRHLAIHRKP